MSGCSMRTKRAAIAERLRFYRELGIYDFYRRPIAVSEEANGCRGTDDETNHCTIPFGNRS